MKTILSLLFLLTSSSLLAQKSIGFTDSTDFKNLIDYRLPDWGYSNFYLSNVGIGVNGTIDNLDRDRNFSDLNSFQYDRLEARQLNLGFGISPAYDYFRESEDLNILANSSLLLSMNKRTNKREDEDNNSGVIINNDRKNSSGVKRIGLNIDVESQKYVSDNFFIEVDWRSFIRYDFDRNSTKIDGAVDITTNSKNRFILIEPNAGIGFGRIRNITPVIRALRLNERYKTLGNTSLTKQEIEFSSVQFTRYQGYQRRYDRPLKYFWKDLDNGIDSKLSGLNAFDLFYLNDVFNENLGSRFEGYSIILTGGYSYSNSLSKQDYDDSTPDQRSFSIVRVANTELSAQWYKNLNLNHQISAGLSNQIYFPLEKRISTELSFMSQFESGWLWVLSDLFQLNNQLRITYNRERIKNIELFKEHNLFTNVSSQLSYFIENKLLLSTSFGLNQRHQSRDYALSDNLYDESLLRNSWDISFSISLRYYLNRNLF